MFGSTSFTTGFLSFSFCLPLSLFHQYWVTSLSDDLQPFLVRGSTQQS